MNVYRDLNAFEKLPASAVTVGTFDGVHIGHQKVLRQLKEAAEKKHVESTVFTLWPHPRFVINNQQENFKLLSSLDEKIELLQKNGIDNLVIVPFTKAFSGLTSEQFIEDIIIEKTNLNTFVIGYDHRFGKGRAGDFEMLKNFGEKYDFEVIEISRCDLAENTVSSTGIRELLAKGNVSAAKEALGRPYSIHAGVVQGDQRGRTIGYPTANLEVPESFKLIPADGVYAVTVDVKGQSHDGMMNIGFRPTVDGTKHVLEVNIFDFDEIIYGERVQVHFHEFIRSEKEFNGLDELKAQLGRDKERATVILTTNSQQ